MNITGNSIVEEKYILSSEVVIVSPSCGTNNYQLGDVFGNIILLTIPFTYFIIEIEFFCSKCI